ncbi:MAG: GYD domain-containing protein [bacterium]
MPTYISLMRWTQQGVANVKDSPRRLDSGRKAFSETGVQIKSVHMTMGRYDLVMVIEAPSDDAVATALLSLASQGNVQTETLKAWTEDEYRQIVGSI